MKHAILIAGPTASGKSEVALTVAKALGGVIVNADSIQVYEDLPILTARPGPAELAAAPHALYGFVKAGKTFSVADWLKAAREAAETTWKAGQIPIFTGGTGLYFTALQKGIAEIPEVPAEIRSELQKRLEKEGLESLYAELGRIDPETSRRLEAGDTQRILRALEVARATGVAISEWQRKSQTLPFPGADFLKICLECEREPLNRAIRKRLEGMISGGALEEVKDFLEKDTKSAAARALGFRPLARHLGGEIMRDEALDLAVIETRQYAKRQRTWFRNQFADWTFVAAGADAGDEIVSLARERFKE